MVPIGIVTRNRVTYLDVTLRSLSGTTLPAETPVVVYDDASNDRATQAYLRTNKLIQVPRQWPAHRTWHKTLGLGVINAHDAVPRGIKGKVAVERLGNKPLGVVEASCEAIRRLGALDPDSPGVLLLQDDILLNPDWYTRMLQAVATTDFPQPLGVLAGIKINQNFDNKLKKPWPPVFSSGITAQCLYVSRTAIETLDMFKERQTSTQEFDTILRKRMASNNLWAGVILPFVCQHFGVQSMVRPRRNWHRGPRGRVGHYSNPPYAMTGEVKQF